MIDDDDDLYSPLNRNVGSGVNGYVTTNT